MHQTLSDRWNRVSLRSKITGVTVLMLTLGLLVSGIGTMAMLRQYVTTQVDARLQTVATGGLTQYFSSGSGVTINQVRPETMPSDYFVALFNSEGTFLDANWDDKPAGERPVLGSGLTLENAYSMRDSILALHDAAGTTEFHAIAVPITLNPQGEIGTALIAVSLRETDNIMATYLSIFLGFGAGVVVLGALITRMLVTTTFSPLREVERTAAAIADGDFSQRLGGATPNTEVGRLNRSLNTMLSRIDRAFKDRARTIEQMRRFVGDASHELRTPLVSVRGYAELYRMGALQTPEDVGQAMERIEKEAIRMGGLVEDLLSLARLDEAKPLELAPVDLVPIARDAALDTMASAPDRVVTVILPGGEAASADSIPTDDELAPAGGVGSTGPIAFAGATIARLRGRRYRRADSDAVASGTIVASAGADAATPPSVGADGAGAYRTGPYDTGSHSAATGGGTGGAASSGDAGAAGGTAAAGGTGELPPAVVLGEENKVRQVLTNLLGNAMRFSPTGSPIEIGVTVDTATDRAVLSVSDHGEGVPPQIREKIFQRFWRADTSRTRETGGSGLGLAIVSSIVAAHNGTVDVVETPGGGATFRVSLPLATSTAAPQPLEPLEPVAEKITAP